jgi:hypothetical protein
MKKYFGILVLVIISIIGCRWTPEEMSQFHAQCKYFELQKEWDKHSHSSDSIFALPSPLNDTLKMNKRIKSMDSLNVIYGKIRKEIDSTRLYTGNKFNNIFQ